MGCEAAALRACHELLWASFIIMFHKLFFLKAGNEEMMGWDEMELGDIGKELSHVVFE